MRKIDRAVHTVLETGAFAQRTVSEVASDDGRWLDRYQDLVNLIAEMAYGNPQFKLLFRGQHQDYRESLAGAQISSLFPSLWRRGPRGRHQARQVLEQWCNHLQGLSALTRQDRRQLRGIPERPWAILQHYSSVTGCDTPLLDVTESIRVAASFATRGYLGKEPNPNSSGVVFVFGFPAIHQGTTISVDDGLILLRLGSVCPHIAARPHFQSGYLAGSFPTERNWGKEHKNFALRLIGKLRISTADSFWDVDTWLREEALFPRNDQLLDELAKRVAASSTT